MQKFSVSTSDLWKIPEEQSAPAGAEVAVYLAASVDARLAELEKALGVYGRCRSNCLTFHADECTCGWVKKSSELMASE